MPLIQNTENVNVEGSYAMSVGEFQAPGFRTPLILNLDLIWAR